MVPSLRAGVAGIGDSGADGMAAGAIATAVAEAEEVSVVAAESVVAEVLMIATLMVR